MRDAGEFRQEYLVSNDGGGTQIATRVRVAGTTQTRRKGLLGVREMRDGEGVWIAPCEAVHTVGMQMPIDVIFLDQNHTVRKLVAGLPPWRMAVCFAAHSVLEVTAGAISASGVQIGDRLTFEAVSREVVSCA